MAVGFIILIMMLGVGFYLFFFRNEAIKSPLGQELKNIIKPLDKYTFENLKKREFPLNPITFGKVLKDEKKYTSRIFYYNIDKEALGTSRPQKVSGLINTPKEKGTYPVIIMYRGFVPREKYFIGNGTQRSGEYFAQNGFITVAPDFLGYGESDTPKVSSIEERFQTYPAALQVLQSVKTLNSALAATQSGSVKADLDKIGIWGHSNGGHMSLSVLAITGKSYPTVLWAPVSKPFPYSILYFTDDIDDHGKALRKVVADFEKDYDAEKYSPTNFEKDIKTSFQIHQGEADEAVPVRWSDQLVESLKKNNQDVEYFTYPGADHNMAPLWNTAVARSLFFFQKKLILDELRNKNI